MARKKSQYHYISGLYNIVKKNGKKGSLSTSFICSADKETNPSGIPTMGFMVKSCRKYAEKKGGQYVDGSFFIMSIIKLTKEQYDALNDTNEPEDKA